ncbi:MAG: hypothetical protein IT299_05070 [Dehalococcoidia bacterium]|nr:hypothetical protein [Dehalococcoidia bacterium]
MPPDDVMQALVAGLIAGSTTAFACTTVLLVALRRGALVFGRMPAVGIPMPLVGMALMNGFLLGWTALGLALGAAAHALEGSRPADGLASPNLLFTSVVIGSVGMLLGVAAFVRGRLGWPVLAMAGSAVVAFGWLLPWLALSGR